MGRFCLLAIRAAAVAATMLAVAVPASATVFITNYSVTATYAAGLPFSSLTATYSLRYDSSISQANNAISLLAFSLDLNGVHYDTSNTGKQFLFPATNPKTLQIGATFNGAGGIAQRTNDFRFTYAYVPDYTNTAAGGAFPAPEFIVAAPSASGVRSATSLVVTRLPPAIPEPATWALMLAGFGLVGAALRGRRLRREQADEQAHGAVGIAQPA